MILSFGWTADLLPPHGCKCETRRNAKQKRVVGRDGLDRGLQRTASVVSRVDLADCLSLNQVHQQN